MTTAYTKNSYGWFSGAAKFTAVYYLNHRVTIIWLLYSAAGILQPVASLKS